MRFNVINKHIRPHRLLASVPSSLKKHGVLVCVASVSNMRIFVLNARWHITVTGISGRVDGMGGIGGVG